RRTKIVCTIGPASSSFEVIKSMILAGMDVARLNFSHGTHEQHKDLIQNLRQASEEIGRTVAILQDLSGPKIRIGLLKNSVELKAGSTFILTTKDLIGDEEKVSVNYPNLPKDLKPDDIVLMSDGTIALKVIEKSDYEVICKVLVGGSIASHKGLNVPTSDLKIPALTEKDKKDLKFGIENGVDVVAISFVRKPLDIEYAKKIISENGSDIPVIAKIETLYALKNIDGIIDASYGIMVARGDLGVETPFENIPLIQKELIEKTKAKGKPVITATQMLRSMVEHPRPTRAEVSDVASAIFDGTDAVMLSEETAIGKYPIESVSVMSKIAKANEVSVDLRRRRMVGERACERPAIETKLPFSEYRITRKKKEYDRKDILSAISHAACLLASELNASAILAPTRSGTTARMVACHRPRQPIIAVSPNISTVRKLCLSWGTYPFLSKEAKNTDERMDIAKKIAINSGFLKEGDVVVITSGPPIGPPGTTNLIKAEII
ncbi:MAG: pyruvate kinase, partial [Methanosarcinales archaeon]